MTFAGPGGRPAILLLMALLAVGLLLSGCKTRNSAPRGTAASTMASQDRSWADDSASAAMRRLFSPLRQGPSGR